MPYVVALCQVILAATLLLAANGKVLRSAQFVDALRLSHLPEVAVSLFSVCIPVFELLLALGLFLSSSAGLSIIFGAIGLLLAAFTTWMGYVSLRNMRIRCGCFGTASDTIGPRSITRNAILLGCALLGCVLSLTTSSILPTTSLEMVIIVASSELCLALIQSFYGARSFLLLTEKDMASKKGNSLSQTG